MMLRLKELIFTAITAPSALSDLLHFGKAEDVVTADSRLTEREILLNCLNYRWHPKEFANF